MQTTNVVETPITQTHETKGFSIFTFIIALFFIGFSIANIVYFKRIRDNNSNCSIITTGEATAMLVINVILLIIAIILVIWGLFRLVFPAKYKHYTTQLGQSIYSQPTNQGDIPMQVMSKPVTQPF